eukprot:TRINITY_DN111_c0_g2_i2.p1 TRINITY_DN111_c0_g2~~TRINITY_DN111_c0_g2_i2.p1  ORF type:complete len:392 (-),score=57.00 TRINITY_DN111_c0_g2_i2:1048-2223(-)
MAGTLAAILQTSQNPSGLSLIVPEGPSLTYNELQFQVDSLRTIILSAGVRTGDVVALNLANGLSFIGCFLAVVSARAVTAPLNPSYKLDDYMYYLSDSQAKVVIVPSGSSPDQDVIVAARKLGLKVWEVSESGKEVVLVTEHLSVAPVVGSSDSPVPDDVALILHTSGTTSKPKAVPLTHLNLFSSITNISNTYRLTSVDRTLLVMPLFHVHGLLGVLLSTFLSGGAVICPLRFSATVFWNLVGRYSVTWYSAVPTIHQILLLRAEKEDPTQYQGKLRFIRSCSSSLAQATLNSLQDKFKAPVLEAYGMTEASHQIASNPLPQDGASKAGTVGKVTDLEVSIRDVTQDLECPLNVTGEICIKGKSVTKGYLNRPEANQSSWTTTGWFRTGY